MNAKPKSFRVIAAMQELKKDYMELTTGNIAARMNESTEVIGHYLQSMAKQGVIKRNGMILDWSNNTRVKQMRWKIANKQNEASAQSVSTMHNVPGDQAAKHVLQDSIQHAQ